MDFARNQGFSRNTGDMWPQMQGNAEQSQRRLLGRPVLGLTSSMSPQSYSGTQLTGGVQHCQRWPGILRGASRSQKRRWKRLASLKVPGCLARPGLTASLAQGSQSWSGWSLQKGDSATQPGRVQTRLVSVLVARSSLCLAPLGLCNSSRETESLLEEQIWLVIWLVSLLCLFLDVRLHRSSWPDRFGRRRTVYHLGTICVQQLIQGSEKTCVHIIAWAILI